jgi:serine/threonine protein kinase
MLETDPTKRPSAVDCLSHDFFIENDVPTTDLGPDANNISADIKTFQEK